MHRIRDDAGGLGKATEFARTSLALLLMGACGDRSIAVTDDDGSASSSGTSNASSSGTSDMPGPPDLGPDAVVCGEPGEYAATDEDIAQLAGCEIYQGRIVTLYPQVTDLSPLASLRIIREDLAGGGGNVDLETLDGLAQLEWVGSFHFSQDGLRDLSALGNLAGIDDYFEFLALPNLTNCNGLEQLRSVGGNFRLVVNEELTSLDGLSGLEWIGGELYIEDNEKLASLDGLSGLMQVDGDVTIKLNPLLAPADIDAFVSRIEIGGEVHLD